MMTPQTPQLDEDPQITRSRARIGMVLQDKWRLETLLGVGGMAAVYAATHRNGKRVAVKMLHPEVGHDEELRKRFLQEGYAANTIAHEGAVSVLDDDVAPDGAAFIVMELLEGETVEQRWERSGKRMNARDVLAIADQLLDVLAAAHAKNVVHRDIKPENLFLTRTGVLKVLDFGIARVHEAKIVRPTSTRAGVVMGTPAFMAPEQARARWDEVDGRTDLWAVGATMFTLLSGRHVHQAETQNEELILSATVPASPLASVVRGVMPQVAAIVDRALVYDRTGRWPDARTMQGAVRAVLDAVGGSESVASSGRRPSAPALGGTGTLVSGQAAPSQPAVHAGAATMIDTTGAASAVAAWTIERDQRVGEVARLRAALADLQQRQAATKKGVAEAQARVEAGQHERTSLEQWFKRQVGTRTAAVEEARKDVRRQMTAIARSAIGDRGAFGGELDAAREGIVKLENAAESAARDVMVHEGAIEAYDVRSLRIGVVLLGVLAALLLTLVVAPIVWRATRVVEPPIPKVAPAPPATPAPPPRR
jgi:serine/threonine-protein kinase